jgi:hypothetical protein
LYFVYKVRVLIISPRAGIKLAILLPPLPE